MNEIFSKSFPCFDLENSFILSNIRPELDSNAYFCYMNAPHVKSFISAGNLPNSIEKAREDLQYWASLFNMCRGFYWGIRHAETNTLVGTLGFNTMSFVHLKGEISYDLAYEYWNRGIMTRAINKVSDFVFKKLNFVRIQAYTAKNNKKSKKLLERCKFKAEGVLKKFELLNGEHLDYIMYSLIR
jgi:ribosomal-protein-alanine N-acetyltransferase